MLTNELSESILHTLNTEFQSSVVSLFDCESKFVGNEASESKNFNPLGEVIVIVDFLGIISGFVAISGSKLDFMALLDLDSSKEGPEALQLIESPTKELLNTISGKCVKILQNQYPSITMLTPKIILGNVSFPRVSCLNQDLTSDEGTFRLTYSIDTMKLDVATLLNKLQSSQQTKETVVNSLHHLYGNLEKVQSHVAKEVSNTIDYIRTIEKLVDKEIPELKDLIGFNLDDTIDQLDSTKNMMKNKIGDTIGDLKEFQNTLLNRLIHKKIWNGDNQLNVWLQGYLSDESNLNFFSDIHHGKLTIYTTDVTGANDEGITRWQGKMALINDQIEIRYKECSTEFIDLALETKNFIDTSQIKSVIASFHCAKCQVNEKFLIKVDARSSKSDAPKAICNCGGKMHLNANQDNIQEFLRSKKATEFKSITATHKNQKKQHIISHLPSPH
ncbi:MAG: hypothetical protein COB04_02650 [Gammaproteobacteria bacterium]|nr:MAG: hypothetical protein COB04_02650 [Gammaproteobacteria bacterium]